MKRFFARHALLKRLLVTAGIVTVFLIGHYLPLPQVSLRPFLAQNALLSFTSRLTGGSISSIGLFSLGQGPWMSAMILERLFFLGKKRQSSPKQDLIRRGLTMLVIAVIQGLSLAIGFEYQQTLLSPLMIFETTLILVAGAFVMAFLANQNTAFGIGGSTVLILVNIMIAQFQQWPIFVALFQSTRYRPFVLFMVIWSLISFYWMLLMDKAEYRIPLKRISIHNKYDPVNYLPIKLNSAGGMALMYVFTILGLFQYLLILLQWLIPRVFNWSQLAPYFTYQTSIGLFFYALTVFGLTLGFAFINVDTTLMSQSLRHAGDFIPGVRPGKATKAYIHAILWRLSLVSATLLTLLIMLPWLLIFISPQLQPLSMLTGVVMMTAGMFMGIRDEVNLGRLRRNYKGIFANS